MNFFNKSLAIAALAIAFTSCSEESITLEELTQEAPLKSYSLSRDLDGTYTLEHTLSEGISSNIINTTDGSEIILNEGGTDVSSKSTALPLINGDIKIDFITENEVKIPGISILDTKTSSTASSKDIDYIRSYSISLLEDGSYQLNYELANNYVPTYDYNEALDRHEIILEKGVSAKNNYSKNYLKFEGQKLNIVFVRKELTTTLGLHSRSRFIVEPPIFTVN